MRTIRATAASALLVAATVAAGAPIAAPAQAATATRAPDVAAATVDWTVSRTGSCPSGTEPLRASKRNRVEDHARKARLRLLVCVPTAVEPTPAQTTAPTTAPIASTEPTPTVTGWRADMLARVNDVRTARGSRALSMCAPIERAAQSYAELMAATGHFAHTGPDGSQPWDRMRAEGYRWTSAGENIAYGYGDVASVMQGWIDSPGHYANLIGTSFTHVGFGQAVSSAGRVYWVQEFGAGGAC